jgi:hypothetical protein
MITILMLILVLILIAGLYSYLKTKENECNSKVRYKSINESYREMEDHNG